MRRRSAGARTGNARVARGQHAAALWAALGSADPELASTTDLGAAPNGDDGKGRVTESVMGNLVLDGVEEDVKTKLEHTSAPPQGKPLVPRRRRPRLCHFRARQSTGKMLQSIARAQRNSARRSRLSTLS